MTQTNHHRLDFLSSDDPIQAFLELQCPRSIVGEEKTAVGAMRPVQDAMV